MTVLPQTSQKKNKVVREKAINVANIASSVTSAQKEQPAVAIESLSPSSTDVEPQIAPSPLEEQSAVCYSSLEPTYSPEEYAELEPSQFPKSIKQDVNPETSCPMDSSNIVQWLSRSSEHLSEIWLEATNVGVVLPSKASSFCEVHTEEPNHFVVSFPANAVAERDYCESEKQKISGRLAKKLGGRVTLRCVINGSVVKRVVSTAETEAENNRSDSRFNTTPSTTNIVSSQISLPGSSTRYANRNVNKQTKNSNVQSVNFHEISQQLENNEVVRELKELFDSELSEVKQTPPPERKTHYFF